ncbi:MAG: response regulator [Acidobacteria bacterium]|nr:response regulator [Acidobacteriota bacterium]
MAGETRVISVVEDEPTIREAVCFALRREGFAPEAFSDGAAAWDAFTRALPDLVVLDIGLPRMDGLDLCRRLRGRSAALPIIFVTSREDEFDRVLGLEIGADDYLCKPFSMRELMARIKVLLRRSDLRDAPASGDGVIRAGDMVLDSLRMTTSWKGMTVPLTVTEFMLLAALARRPGIVKTREHLMEEAYPDRVHVSDRTIDSHVKRIRRKIETVDPRFLGIESVYGAGYRFLIAP